MQVFEAFNPNRLSSYTTFHFREIFFFKMKDLTDPGGLGGEKSGCRIMFLEPPLPEEQAELRQENAGSPHPGSCPCRAAMTENGDGQGWGDGTGHYK